MDRMLVTAGLLTLVTLGDAGAVEGLGSAAFGRRLTVEQCGSCHVVTQDQEPPAERPAANLVQWARKPGATEVALRTYLQTSHPVMPNIKLTPEQTDDIVAYLLSLRGGR